MPLTKEEIETQAREKNYVAVLCLPQTTKVLVDAHEQKLCSVAEMTRLIYPELATELNSIELRGISSWRNRPKDVKLAKMHQIRYRLVFSRIGLALRRVLAKYSYYNDKIRISEANLASIDLKLAKRLERKIT